MSLKYFDRNVTFQIGKSCSHNFSSLISFHSISDYLFHRGVSFDGATVGMASLGAMCSQQRSGGVNEVRRTKTGLLMALYDL